MIMQNASAGVATRLLFNGGLKLSTAVRALWMALVRRHRQRRTIAILESLDDRTLKDIGLYRSEIHSIAINGGAGRRINCLGCR
jgi:uncharacterized protein YjiS (DUF1127 family)